MRTGRKGIALIQEFEGCYKKLPDGRYQAYLDKLPRKALWSPGYKGLWTIGYGSTGPDVTEGTIWTMAQVTAGLMRHIATHEDALNAKAKALNIKLDQNQFDALICASYNLGHESGLITSVLKKLAAGDEDGAGKVFLGYNHAGGKVVSGLTRRRKAEKELFDTYTVAQLVDDSPQLSLMSNARKTIVASGVGGYLTWDNYLNVRNVVDQHMGLILLGLGIGAWLLFKLLEKHHVSDYEDGRYIPSGQ